MAGIGDGRAVKGSGLRIEDLGAEGAGGGVVVLVVVVHDTFQRNGNERTRGSAGLE
jgi:hypothetical protein